MDFPEYQLKTNFLQRSLGEYLLAEGMLTSDQLDEAIEFQCIYGGKLGTSLVELGYIEEDLLAKILSKQQKLHYIKPDLLMYVPPQILKLVPQNLALQYQVVPYHQDGKRLYLAMSDATNLANIDALSFQLDHIIVPLAIPEIRLMLALKKHYGMALSPRFEALSAQFSRRAQKRQGAIPVKKNKPEASPSQDEEEAWPLLGDEEYEGTEYQDEAMFGIDAAPAEISYVSLGQQLAEASERDDIARAIINFLNQKFQASGLFMVRSGQISGWMAACNGKLLDNFDQFSIPVHEASAFNLVMSNKTNFLGQVIDTPQNRRLLDHFSGTPPKDALIIPLQVRERLVCMLYVQDLSDKLQSHQKDLKNIAEKAEMSFTLLILKNKLQTT